MLVWPNNIQVLVDFSLCKSSRVGSFLVSNLLISSDNGL